VAESIDDKSKRFGQPIKGGFYALSQASREKHLKAAFRHSIIAFA
jgi:hypothetical protein